MICSRCLSLMSPRDAEPHDDGERCYALCPSCYARPDHPRWIARNRRWRAELLRRPKPIKQQTNN